MGYYQDLDRDIGDSIEVVQQSIQSKKDQYTVNRAARTKSIIQCANCFSPFEKKTYHHCFCAVSCKDMFWNTTDENRKMRANLFAK